MMNAHEPQKDYHELSKALHGDNTDSIKANVHEDYHELSTRKVHADTMDSIKAVFVGHLKYGATARSEIFSSSVLEEMAKGEQTHTNRLKSAVRTVRILAGQNVLDDKKLTKNDEQVLFVKQGAWLEVADPKHRHSGALSKYFPVWEESDSPMNFFEWLDYGPGKDLDLEVCPRKTLDTSIVKYLTTIERESYLVKPRRGDGKLQYEQSGQVLEGELIFVMSVKGSLYAGQKVTGRFHHSSFLGGACVKVAGIMTIEHGEIKCLIPHSGHYHPSTKDFQAFIRQLEEDGLSQESLRYLQETTTSDNFGEKRMKRK